MNLSSPYVRWPLFLGNVMAYDNNSEANDRKNSNKRRVYTEAGYDSGSTDLDLALERFKDSDDNSDHNRIKYEQDVEFGRLGDQWDEAVAQARHDESRPCLTINKLPSLFVRLSMNRARTNRGSW